MQIERKRVADLKAALYNPRVDLKRDDARYRKLRRSLQQFGLVEPLIWNRRTDRIVGGHQRLKILRELDIPEVDVSVVDLDEDHEKALNIVLNNREAQSDFNLDRLTPVLLELQERGELRSTGFDPAHLDILQSRLEPASVPPLELSGRLAPRGEDNWEIILHVPTNKIDIVRPALDQLIAQHNLEVHVRSR